MKKFKLSKLLIVSSLLILSLFSLSGCNKTDAEVPEFSNIKGDEAKKIINENKDIVILDVRTVEEYNEGHIKGAINIPVDELENRLDDLKDYKEKMILVYCKSGNRSSKASKTLAFNGFKQVVNMEDGVGEYNYDLVN